MNDVSNRKLMNRGIVLAVIGGSLEFAVIDNVYDDYVSLTIVRSDGTIHWASVHDSDQIFTVAHRQIPDGVMKTTLVELSDIRIKGPGELRESG